MSIVLSSRSGRLKYEELFIKFWGTLKNDDNLLKNSSGWSDAQKRVIAEEILRLRYIEGIKELNLPEQLQNVHLGDLPLKYWLNAESASVAAFPLNNLMNDKFPVLVRLWIFRGKNLPDDLNSSQLNEGSDIVKDDYRILLTGGDLRITEQKQPIAGKSWQLAYSLAEKALENKHLKRNLAYKWIVTGTVDDNKVGHVDIGNKFLLMQSGQKWLIPYENIRDTAGFSLKNNVKIRGVDTVSNAVVHITGQGTKNIGEEELVSGIDELHMLVGANIKAQVASILLTQPEKVVLWHSDNVEFSVKSAEMIEKVIEKIMPEIKYNIKKIMISDKSIQDAEKTLFEYFDKNKNSDGKIIFNVTSGNRLMSYAVQTIARLFPKIDLIYRELGEKEPHKFVLLNYREMPPFSGCVTGKLSLEISDMNESFLYDKENYTSADDFLTHLFRC